jgi:hypothetical protein
MNIVVVAGAQDGPVVQAFREEAPGLVVVPADCDVTAVAAELAGCQPGAIVAASAAAAPVVAALHAALGSPDGTGGLPIGYDAVPASAAADVLGGDDRYCVALVSREGAHGSAGVYEDRFVVRNDRKLLRSRTSVEFGSEIAVVVEASARSYLDAVGVRDGATCVEVDLAGGQAHPVGVTPGVMCPAPPVDAAFRAYGHSHPHLLAESVLRPREVQGRLVRPLQPGRTTLALIVLRAPADGVLRGAAALRTLRRLTGFYGVSEIRPPATLEPGAIAAIATFVHTDRASVVNSLTALAEIEEAGEMFVEDLQLIGHAPTPS